MPHVGNFGIDPQGHGAHRVSMPKRRARKKRIVQPLINQMSDESMSDEDDFSSSEE